MCPGGAVDLAWGCGIPGHEAACACKEYGFSAAYLAHVQLQVSGDWMLSQLGNQFGNALVNQEIPCISSGLLGCCC